MSDLTDIELSLFQGLPGPPVSMPIRMTNIWIVEWLPQNERHTGLLLHEWTHRKWPGLSEYCKCRTKQDVILAIERATIRAQTSEMFPVLHLEAHGGDHGLEGPDAAGGRELLQWDELNKPLQNLNLATRCNLAVVIAACIGFAGIQAFRRGPRAPAAVLVGPDTNLTPRDLLEGAKEFYRCCMDKNPRLLEIAASASVQAGTANFEWEPFAVLAYEALIGHLIVSMRPDERRHRVDRIRQRILAENTLSVAEIERRLDTLSTLPPASELQRIWDEMFMIDLYPENRERFGVDMSAIIEQISRMG